MNKKGFTLMELLLVVAVLAIVAAAAAPTFFGGAQEAMDEAKKASMNSAYQNCISGCNMLVALAASKGIEPDVDKHLQWTDKTNGNEVKTLDYYSPVAARVFHTKKGTAYIFSAKYNKTNRKIDIYYGAGTTDSVAGTALEPEGTTYANTKAALDALWDSVKEK